MNVLIISEYFPPQVMGGGEISAYNLAKGLSQKGIGIHVLTSKGLGAKESIEDSGITIHRVLETGRDAFSIRSNIKRMLVFEKDLLKKLPEVVKNNEIDIVHCMNITSIVAVKLKKRLDIPFILHVNSPVLFCPKGTLMYKDKKTCDVECSMKNYISCYMKSHVFGKTWINLPVLNPFLFIGIRKRYQRYKDLLKSFDYYLAISKYMESRLIKGHIDKKKIDVIYNPLGLDDFLELKIKKNKAKKILFLGDYTEAKGAGLLMDVLLDLDKDFEADFFGRGPLEDALIKKADREKNIRINKKVEYNNIPNLISKADILVYPSIVAEAFGRSVLEASASGKTVVAANVGGIGEIIEDKVTGYLFRPGDYSDLKKKILLALDYPLDPKKIKKYVSQKFSPEKQIKNTIRAYERVTRT